MIDWSDKELVVSIRYEGRSRGVSLRNFIVSLLAKKFRLRNFNVSGGSFSKAYEYTIFTYDRTSGHDRPDANSQVNLSEMAFIRELVRNESELFFKQDFGIDFESDFDPKHGAYVVQLLERHAKLPKDTVMQRRFHRISDGEVYPYAGCEGLPIFSPKELFDIFSSDSSLKVDRIDMSADILGNDESDSSDPEVFGLKDSNVCVDLLNDLPTINHHSDYRSFLGYFAQCLFELGATTDIRISRFNKRYVRFDKGNAVMCDNAELKKFAPDTHKFVPLHKWINEYDERNADGSCDFKLEDLHCNIRNRMPDEFVLYSNAPFTQTSSGNKAIAKIRNLCPELLETKFDQTLRMYFKKEKNGKYSFSFSIPDNVRCITTSDFQSHEVEYNGKSGPSYEDLSKPTKIVEVSNGGDWIYDHESGEEFYTELEDMFLGPNLDTELTFVLFKKYDSGVLEFMQAGTKSSIRETNPDMIYNPGNFMNHRNYVRGQERKANPSEEADKEVSKEPSPTNSSLRTMSALKSAEIEAFFSEEANREKVKEVLAKLREARSILNYAQGRITEVSSVIGNDIDETNQAVDYDNVDKLKQIVEEFPETLEYVKNFMGLTLGSFAPEQKPPFDVAKKFGSKK